MSAYESLKQAMEFCKDGDDKVVVLVKIDHDDAELFCALVEAARETQTTLINPSPVMQRFWAALARVLEETE